MSASRPGHRPLSRTGSSREQTSRVMEARGTRKGKAYVYAPEGLEPSDIARRRPPVRQLAGCGDSNDTGSSTSSSGNGKNKNSRSRSSPRARSNNRSWANSWADGRQAAAKETGAQVTMVGNVETPDQYPAQGSSFAPRATTSSSSPTAAMNDPAVKLARQFPKTTFVQAPFEFADTKGQLTRPANLGHIDFKQEQGTFLAGALAGLVTKTNKVAAVNGYAFPALTRQPEAFSLGARCVNPKVKFSQKYINSLTTRPLARPRRRRTSRTAPTCSSQRGRPGVSGHVPAAEPLRAPAYVIPSVLRQPLPGPKVVLTSVLYNLTGVAADIIRLRLTATKTASLHQGLHAQEHRVGELAALLQPRLRHPPGRRGTRYKHTSEVLSGKIRSPTRRSAPRRSASRSRPRRSNSSRSAARPK